MKYLALLFLLSCAHSYHQAATDVSLNPGYKSGRTISAVGEQFVVLGFINNTDYVQEAYDDLAKQCEEGTVSPLTTRYYTSLSFLSWTNYIKLEGICVQ